MNTCQHCRYWRRNHESEWGGDSTLFGDCVCSKLAYGGAGRGQVWYRITTENPDTTQEIPDKQATDMLLYEDYSSYMAGIQTGQDFGCIHWKAKGAGQLT